MGKSQPTSCCKSQEPLSLPDPDKAPCRFFLVADDTGSLAVHEGGREEDGEFFPAPLPPSAPPPPFMHMFVQFEMAFRYCYGSRFVCALLVVRARCRNFKW